MIPHQHHPLSHKRLASPKESTFPSKKADFIAYLKKTPELPLKPPAHIQQHPRRNADSSKSPNPSQVRLAQIIQDDFSKISTKYVLDEKENRLRKKSFIYNRNSEEKGNTQEEQTSLIQAGKRLSGPQQIEIIKELTKLQYLEKQGYLTEEEKARLMNIRQQGWGRNRSRGYPSRQGSMKQPRDVRSDRNERSNEFQEQQFFCPYSHPSDSQHPYHPQQPSHLASNGYYPQNSYQNGYYTNQNVNSSNMCHHNCYPDQKPNNNQNQNQDYHKSQTNQQSQQQRFYDSASQNNHQYYY